VKTTILLSTALASLVATSAAAQSLQSVEPITTVQPMQDTDGEFRICTGSDEGAYYDAASLMTGVISNQGDVNAVAYEAGGTVDCLYRLAAGEVQAAIVQRDGLAWLHSTQSPLYGQLGIGGNVLTEEVLGFCRRTIDDDNLNDVLQARSGHAVAIAGGPTSGTNLTLNVLAGFDRQIGTRPEYTYTGGLADALQRVQDGFASCAVAVMSSDTFTLEALDDEYADGVRLVEFWDNDVRDLEFPGGEFDDGQVYGWRTITRDHDMMDDFLDWKGNRGEGSWDPDTVAFFLIFLSRKDTDMFSMKDVRKRAEKALAAGKGFAGSALEKAQGAWADSATTRAEIAEKLKGAADGAGEYASSFTGSKSLDLEKVQRLAEAIIAARLLELDDEGNPDPIDSGEALELAIELAKRYEGLVEDDND